MPLFARKQRTARIVPSGTERALEERRDATRCDAGDVETTRADGAMRRRERGRRDAIDGRDTRADAPDTFDAYDDDPRRHPIRRAVGTAFALVAGFGLGVSLGYGIAGYVSSQQAMHQAQRQISATTTDMSLKPKPSVDLSDYDGVWTAIADDDSYVVDVTANGKSSLLVSASLSLPSCDRTVRLSPRTVRIIDGIGEAEMTGDDGASYMAHVELRDGETIVMNIQQVTAVEAEDESNEDGTLSQQLYAAGTASYATASHALSTSRISQSSRASFTLSASRMSYASRASDASIALSAPSSSCISNPSRTVSASSRISDVAGVDAMLPMIPTGNGGFLRDVCGYVLTIVGHIAQAFADLADALEFDGVAEHLRASANQAFDHAEELLSSDDEGASDRDNSTDDGVDFEDMPYMVLTVADTSDDVMAQHGVTPAIVTNSDGTAGTSTQLPDWYDLHNNPNGLSDAVESRLDLSGDGLLRIDCVLANTVPDAADDGDESTDDDASGNADGDNATDDDDTDGADGKDDAADSQSDDDEAANDNDEMNDADDAESDASDEDDANDASAGSDADAVGYGRTMVGGEVVAGDDVSVANGDNGCVANSIVV